MKEQYHVLGNYQRKDSHQFNFIFGQVMNVIEKHNHDYSRVDGVVRATIVDWTEYTSAVITVGTTGFG